MDIMDHLKRDTFKPLAEPEVEQAISRLMQAVQDETSATVQSYWSVQRWLGYVSVVAVLVIGAFGVKHLNILTSSPSVTKTYTTQFRQRATITLTDGSKVTLAPATTLKVAGRTVELNGEALFTVVHGEGQAFTVKTNHSITSVLGTTFSVRGYDNDQSVRVVVAEGKVSVNSSILTVGDAAVVTSTGTRIQHDVNVAKAFAWSAGRLEFAEVSFAQAIPELERWYGIKVSISDRSFLSKPIVTTLSVDETPAEVVRLIAIALDARGELAGQTAIFTTPTKR